MSKEITLFPGGGKMRDPAKYNEVGKEKLSFGVNNPYIQKHLMLALETVVS